MQSKKKYIKYEKAINFQLNHLCSVHWEVCFVICEGFSSIFSESDVCVGCICYIKYNLFFLIADVS